ncbi:CGNR zinc finger domain-containing protein [Luteimicrobium sp. NPDC057192]|uniref:CGNR zinc finger domain-containing protein n=1 Tax=Luteimicrobium sp. NPDC057192 TaxID=3346042 RepID=UPI00363D445F
MEKTEFRTDGGATWLNLLATRGQSFGAHPVERLPDAAAAAAWLQLVGLPPDAPLEGAELAALVSLREALRELAIAAVEDRPASPEARRLVGEHAATTLPHVAAGDARVPVPVPESLGAIAAQALVTLAGPDRHLLKECAEADCRWVFLDPAGRRRWCPNPACATRGRVRAHRARATAADA